MPQFANLSLKLTEIIDCHSKPKIKKVQELVLQHFRIL